jgi:hypothetical protein
MEGVELIKVYTVRTHREIPLNTDFGVNNERQDCKIGTVCGVLVRGGIVSRGDEGEGRWWMGFIYIHEIEL